MEVILHWLPAIALVLALFVYDFFLERRSAKIRAKEAELRARLEATTVSESTGWVASKRGFTVTAGIPTLDMTPFEESGFIEESRATIVLTRMPGGSDQIEPTETKHSVSPRRMPVAS